MRRDVCDHSHIALGAEPPGRQPRWRSNAENAILARHRSVWTPSKREKAAGFAVRVRLGLKLEQEREQGRRGPSAEGEGWRVYEEVRTSVSQLGGR